MTQPTHRILIGSLGWQHAAWQDNFYPEDLPPEWRLGYYSNEFPLAVVTDNERAGADELPGELADCREDLQVILRLAADADLDAARQWLQQLPRHSAVLLSIDPAAIDGPAAWLAQVQAALAPFPLCVEPLAPLTASWREALGQQGIGWSWNTHSDAQGLAVGPLAVIQVDATVSPRGIRDRIAAGLAVHATRDVALVFAGQPPDIEAMRQARTIEELM